MKTYQNLLVMAALTASGLAFAGPKADLKQLNKQVARSLASDTEEVRSVYHYMDMRCENLMTQKTDDAFLKFARKEIRLGIGEHFCELVKENPATESELEYETQRDYISVAEYSKLIDSLYSSYHFKQR